MLQSTRPATTLNQHMLLHELTQQDPVQVNAWLETIWTVSSDVSAFNWLGLLKIAIVNATAGAQRQQRQTSLGWATVAQTLQRLLSAGSTRRPQSLINDVMVMRVTLILAFGAVPQHPILAASGVLDWFFREADTDYETAACEAQLWTHKHDLDVMRKLHTIKNRLLIMAPLLIAEPLLITAVLADWLALLPYLP